MNAEIDAPIKREVAQRIFAQEFRESTLMFKEGDDQYSPKYLLTPTGAKCNRVVAVGTLTEKEDIGSDSEYWRARVADPTGTFILYTGQYQPDATRALSEIEPPEFVVVVGKANTYETPEGDVIASIRPEAIQIVDESVMNIWIADAIKHTINRLKQMKVQGTENAIKAKEHYYTDIELYKEMVQDALNTLNADESEGVETIDLSK